MSSSGVIKQIEVEVNMTPDLIAEAFSAMSNDEQAAFFVRVAAIMSQWWPSSREMQMHFLASTLKSEGTREARDMVRMLAEMIGETEPAGADHV